MFSGSQEYKHERYLCFFFYVTGVIGSVQSNWAELNLRKKPEITWATFQDWKSNWKDIHWIPLSQDRYFEDQLSYHSWNYL